MEQLPDDVLLMIFEHLPPHDALRSARVCRRWAALAARRALHVRRRADLPRVHAGLHVLLVTASLSALHEELARARHLRELTVSSASPLGPADVEALRHLPHLLHLDVFVRGQVLDAGFASAAGRLTSLVLNETAAPGVLRALAAAPRLRALHMFGRARLYPPRELRALLAARRDHLRELTLRCAELRERAYAALGACPNLTSLQLYSCWQMTGVAALHVVRPPRLRRLHMTGARLVRSRALFALLQALPRTLEELVLSALWFGDVHAPVLRARLPALRALELWRTRVTPGALVELAGALPALRRLDTDLSLPTRHVARLRAHPALQHLRCMPPPAERTADERAEPAAPYVHGARHADAGELRVRAADARYAGAYLRGESEGYRADLLYYWTQGVELPTMRPEEEPEPEPAPEEPALYDEVSLAKIHTTSPAPRHLASYTAQRL